MEAHSLRMEEFLAQAKTRFVIPVYQRNYDWKQSQCRQLLDDIIAIGCSDEGVHFIGSIVFMHDTVYTATALKELAIIDGQQRLTTLTLIYVALYRLAKQLSNELLAEDIMETYLINKFAGNTKKLALTKNNEEAFDFLMKDDPGAAYTQFSNIIENFNYIKGSINQHNYECIRKGLSRLLFVEISLERGKDDPQRIFESLNSTGLDLSQADLIRNYILMGLRREEQQRIYETYWTFIEEKARCTSSNENRVSDFIRDFLTLETGKIPNKNKVYTEFKAKYPSLDTLEEILTKLKRFVQYYNKLINPESEPDKDISGQIKSINDLESAVTYPFLLQIYDDYANKIIDKTVFIEILNLVQSFVWRRFICGLPTNALNKIFMNLYEKVDKARYVYSIQRSLIQRTGSQKFPNDEETMEALQFKDMYNINSRNTRYLLEKLENFKNHEKVLIQGNSDITIEHIFPQNPDPVWKKNLGKEEYVQMGKYLHTISNLTLSGNNGKLGNKSFEDKKNAQDFGYKDSRLWLNKYLASIDAWDSKALEKRFSKIKERFLQIWQYPDIQIDTSEREVNIFEADDPTGKSLDYIIFRDEKKEIETVAALYKEIVRQLLESQPDTFFLTDLAGSIALTRKEDKDKLVLPSQINDNWFIEGGLNNKTKFKKIKHILTVFGLEDDLIIKYAAETWGAESSVDGELEYDKKVKGYAAVTSLGDTGYIGYWGGIKALQNDLADPNKRDYVIHERPYKWREQEKTGSNSKNWIPIKEFLHLFEDL